ncbi:hypothetical protein NA56DRAFT_756540 [Hyaloscypha hepaticicola]|uniref:Uncharacterized protein n=1 Tax=Hyaloscypha hepaticicola TaxID=2082293 RepID=A0A2J6PEW2_9HELO|nr:hypothetical protein NA56DRAFT_756540 [Hyaloscypha hepaticicola]
MTTLWPHRISSFVPVSLVEVPVLHVLLMLLILVAEASDKYPKRYEIIAHGATPSATSMTPDSHVPIKGESVNSSDLKDPTPSVSYFEPWLSFLPHARNFKAFAPNPNHRGQRGSNGKCPKDFQDAINRHSQAWPQVYLDRLFAHIETRQEGLARSGPKQEQLVGGLW